MVFYDINPFYREKEDYTIRNGHCRTCSLWIAEKNLRKIQSHLRGLAVVQEFHGETQ